MEYAVIVIYGYPQEAQDLMNRKAAEGWTVVSVSAQNGTTASGLYTITLGRPRE